MEELTINLVKKIKGSIIVSFRNEELNIVPLVTRIDKSLKSIQDIEYDIIMINDCSTDRSLEVINTLIKDYPIIVVNMAWRAGVIPCIYAGLSISDSDFVVNIEADLQDPPEMIPQLVEQYQKGFDVVHTFRTRRDGESTVKMIMTSLAYKAINRLSSVKLRENCGNFKLLSSRVVEFLLENNESEPYFRGLAVYAGYNQIYLPYERHSRNDGKSIRGFSSGAPYREFIRGIMAFSKLASVTSLFAIIAFMLTVFCVTIFPNTPITSMPVFIILAVIGILILCLFYIQGLYIEAILKETRQRPSYKIESINEYRK